MINNKAFTLSELLLAAAIMVFALAGVLAVFISCISLNEASRNLTIATGHAQYVMEQLKDANFTGLANDITAGNWDWDSTEIGLEGLTALTGESIDTDCILATPDPLEASVTVNWLDKGARNRSLTLVSLFTEQ